MKKYKSKFYEETLNYREMLYENYLKEYSLKEKTFNVGKDVDYIYKVAFKKVIDDFNKEGIVPSEGTYTVIDGSLLKSKDCILAQKKHPIKIYCGASEKGSYVNYAAGSNVMVISLNTSALNVIRDGRVMFLSPRQRKAVENEITEHRIKAAIYHELSHWVSNVKYNSYLHNLIAKIKNISDDDPKKSEKIQKILTMNKVVHTTATTYEIDAQIHAIKQIKRNFSREWDTLTLEDLFYKYTALFNVARTLNRISSKAYDMWIKDLIKRMVREGLLGKNMKTFPKEGMFESIDKENLFTF